MSVVLNLLSDMRPCEMERRKEQSVMRQKGQQLPQEVAKENIVLHALMINLKVSKFISRYELEPIYSADGSQKLHYVIDVFFDGEKFFPQVKRRDFFCIYPEKIKELCDEELLVFDNMEDWGKLSGSSEDEVLNKVKSQIEQKLKTT